MNLAFFDVDKTIFDGYSGSDIFPLLVKKGLAEKELLEWWQDLLRQYQQGKTSYSEISYQIITRLTSHFQGKSPLEISKVMNHFMQTEGRIYPWVKEVVNMLKQREFRIILISASTLPFVEVIGRHVGSDQYFASTCEIQNGKYTGNLRLFLYGPEKKTIVQQLLQKYSPTQTIGFGDSTGDIPMLEMTDYVFVHEPHEEQMRLYAAKYPNWFIVDRGGITDMVRKVL